MNELVEGVELKLVAGPSGDHGYLLMQIGEGSHQCRRIVVSMQPGQMGLVPWARCELNNGEVRLANLAMMEDAVLADAKQSGGGNAAMD